MCNMPCFGTSTPGSVAFRVTLPQAANATSSAPSSSAPSAAAAKPGARPMRMAPRNDAVWAFSASALNNSICLALVPSLH
jgi:hypothetical protein